MSRFKKKIKFSLKGDLKNYFEKFGVVQRINLNYVIISFKLRLQIVKKI
jgi:hypothetical protein